MREKQAIGITLCITIKPEIGLNVNVTVQVSQRSLWICVHDRGTAGPQAWKKKRKGKKKVSVVYGLARPSPMMNAAEDLWTHALGKKGKGRKGMGIVDGSKTKQQQQSEEEH